MVKKATKSGGEAPEKRKHVPNPDGKPERYTVEQVIAALRSSAGVMLAAAVKLGCDRATVYKYVKRHPEIAEALAEIREVVIDTAETHFLSAVQQGKQWAVERVLRTIGKKRGYGDSVELTGPDGGTIPIKTDIVVRFVKPGEVGADA